MRQIGRNNLYTVDEIKNYLKEHELGIELLSTEYKNAHTKLEFKCNTCNYYFTKLFKDIQTRKIGCSSCNKNKEKVTKQDIIDRLQQYGYQLISEVTGDSKQGSIFTVKCFRGHINDTTWLSFNRMETKRGGVCSKCVEEGFGRDRRKLIKEYHNNLAEWKYAYEGELLTHSTDRRNFICENGHVRNVEFYTLKVQPNCPECRGYISKYTQEDIKSQLAEIDIEYLGGYISNKSKINIICHCGKSTHGYFNEILQNKKCRECSGRKVFTFIERVEFYNKNNCSLLELNIGNRKTKYIFKCSCNKLDSKTWDAFKRNPHCSDCANLNRLRGEQHPSWNPNLSEEDRLKSRKYPEYKEWRQSVYKRDNYTCQCCLDSTGGNLEAHHILNHAEYSNLRLEISNGITLCKSCHVEFHMDYGFTNNNQEQLDEFIKNFQSEVLTLA